MKNILKKTVVVGTIGLSMLYAQNKKIICEGSTTVLPIAQRTAEEFMKLNPNANISVRGGGSGVGIASLIEGNCDIALTSRSMKDAEIQKAVSKGKEPKAFVIAMDGISVIVHPTNKISNLTKQQVKDIYTGKISNWAQVGGENKKIVVISRDSASGTFEAFNTLALEGAKVRPDSLMQASNHAVLKMVSKTPNAIGYIGTGFVSEKVKAVDIENVKADKKNILSQKYPYSRALFVYTNGNPQGMIKKYLDYILSAEGQKLVEELGFYGLK